MQHSNCAPVHGKNVVPLVNVAHLLPPFRGGYVFIQRKRFDILSRDKNERLVKTHCVCPCELEADQIVNNKFMKRLKQEWRAPERRAVEFFPLLMAQSFFDYTNTEFRGFRV